MVWTQCNKPFSVVHFYLKINMQTVVGSSSFSHNGISQQRQQKLCPNKTKFNTSLMAPNWNICPNYACVEFSIGKLVHWIFYADSLFFSFSSHNMTSAIYNSFSFGPSGWIKYEWNVIFNAQVLNCYGSEEANNILPNWMVLNGFSAPYFPVTKFIKFKVFIKMTPPQVM